MIEFISLISELLSSILGLFVSLIQMLLSLFGAVFRALQYIGALILCLPPFVLAFVGITIAVSAILFLINHGGE